jgi:hypothetical protein
MLLSLPTKSICRWARRGARNMALISMRPDYGDGDSNRRPYWQDEGFQRWLRSIEVDESGRPVARPKEFQPRGEQELVDGPPTPPKPKPKLLPVPRKRPKPGKRNSVAYSDEPLDREQVNLKRFARKLKGES